MHRQVYQARFDALLSGDPSIAKEPNPLLAIASDWASIAAGGQYVTAGRPCLSRLSGSSGSGNNHISSGFFQLELDMEKPPRIQAEWADWIEDSLAIAVSRHLTAYREAVACETPFLLSGPDEG